jgi:hypothetical protein
MASKIERLPDVQARMAWLRRDDDDLIRRKREEIEAALLAVLTVNVTQFAKIDEDGTITGWDWNKIRDSGLSQILCEIGPDGGPRIKLADKLNALAQLRDMHGFRAPTKVAPTSSDGDGPARMIVQWGSGETLPVLHDTEPAPANEAPSDDDRPTMPFRGPLMRFR